MAWGKLFGRAGSGPAKGAAAQTLDAPAKASTSENRGKTRRSRRVFIAMRVLIRCQRAGQPYEEEASTEAVNANGCLLRLSVVPERGETLTIVNMKSAEAVECRVVYVGHSEGGKSKVGVEFAEQAEYFWHIAFPPDDWDADERRMPPVASATL